MNRFIILLKGDEVRMKKYGITYASLGTSILWVIMMQLVSSDAINRFFPLFLFVDSTMMSFLLVGVAMMFEKQESALKTMLVTPISKHHYLLSKITSCIISSLITLLLLGAYGLVFRDLSIHIAGMIGVVALVSFVFSCLGILFTYRSKDFTVLLMWLAAFFFVLAVPTVLQMFGIISADWFRYVQYINPTQAVLTVMISTVAKVDRIDFLCSLGYLLTLAVILYLFAARDFDRYSMKEFGGE